MSNIKLQNRITRDGFLGNQDYATISNALTSQKGIAFQPYSTSSAQALVSVGYSPSNLGSIIELDRSAAVMDLVSYVNASDELGVCISNFQPGDQIQIVGASGIASFDDPDSRNRWRSIIGVVAVAAEATVILTGFPEVSPVIAMGAKYANAQIKSSELGRKRRDAFGVDPSTGHMARQEGGVIVCLPQAGCTFYSGDEDHKERWIQNDGSRIDANLPIHIRQQQVKSRLSGSYGFKKHFAGMMQALQEPPYAFFPIAGDVKHNERTVTMPGSAYILAWDHVHDDNVGYYRVDIRVIMNHVA